MSESTLAKEMEAIAAATISTVQHAVNEHPFATVAAGVGAGYVLGAGLPSWLVRAGATIGTRVVMREVVSAAVASMTPEPAEPESEVVPCPPSS